jgi:hypothetical protein
MCNHFWMHVQQTWQAWKWNAAGVRALFTGYQCAACGHSWEEECCG